MDTLKRLIIFFQVHSSSWSLSTFMISGLWWCWFSKAWKLFLQVHWTAPMDNMTILSNILISDPSSSVDSCYKWLAWRNWWCLGRHDLGNWERNEQLRRSAPSLIGGIRKGGTLLLSLLSSLLKGGSTRLDTSFATYKWFTVHVE